MARRRRTPQLYNLLLSLFSADELRRWIRHSDYAVLSDSIPGSTVSRSTLVSDVIAAMERRGFINAEFFRRLEEERPARAGEIREVAEGWSGAGQVPSPGSGGDVTAFPRLLHKKGFTPNRKVAPPTRTREGRTPTPEGGHYDAETLATLTVASARSNDEVIRSLLELTALSRRSIENKLADTDGGTRLEGLFAERWPTRAENGEQQDDERKPEDDADDSSASLSLRELATRTTASARDDGAVIDALVQITGLSKTTVQSRMRRADGRFHLKNLFLSRWPDEHGAADVDLSAFGARTAASARDDGVALALLSELTGLSEPSVRTRLCNVDGRYRLRTVFAENWPGNEDAADEEDSHEEEDSYEKAGSHDEEDSYDEAESVADTRVSTAEELSGWTVASARDDDAAVRSLMQITGLSRRWVRRHLNAADGRVRLRHVFAKRWPKREVAVSDDVDLDELGVRTVASARDDDTVIAAIARVTDLTARAVQRRLRKADGRGRVRGVFAASWPEDEESDDEVWYSADELADETAAAARSDDEILDSLVRITHLTTATIRRKLLGADGRVRLRNLFSVRWPDADADADDLAPGQLGTRTTASARDDEQAITAIVELTGLAERTVRRRLREADGRYRLHTVFANAWPDEDEYDGDTSSYTAEDLSDWTAASARDDDDALDALTEITGLSMRWVKRHLNNVDGRMHIRNVFAHRWPDEEDDTGDAERLAHMRVASARDDLEVFQALARITRISEGALRRRLLAADGRTHLGTLFQRFWPE